MGWIRADSLEGVAQKEADFAAVVALFAIALVSLAQPVQFWFDLPNAGQLLTLLLTMEIRAGELVSHGLRPRERPEGEQHTHTCTCIDNIPPHWIFHPKIKIKRGNDIFLKKGSLFEHFGFLHCAFFSFF